MVSVFGSQVTFRFSRTEMSHRWLMTSERTASRSVLTGCCRDLTASIKFCQWFGLSTRYTSLGPILDSSNDAGSAEIPDRRIFTQPSLPMNFVESLPYRKTIATSPSWMFMFQL